MSTRKPLSPRELESLGPFADRWIATGLSTDPIDRPSVEQAMAWLYHCAGFKAPTKFIWCQSPLAMDLAYRLGGAEVIHKRSLSGVWNDAHSIVKNAVRNSAWRIVNDAFYGKVSANVCCVRDLVCTNLNHSDCTSIPDSVWNGLSDSLWEADLGHDYDSSRLRPKFCSDWWAGSHDSYWIGFLNFFREGCGLWRATAKLEGLVAVAQTCGWFIPCDNTVYVSPRPSEIDLGRKIVTYGDGFECRPVTA